MRPYEKFSLKEDLTVPNLRKDSKEPNKATKTLLKSLGSCGKLEVCLKFPV